MMEDDRHYYHAHLDCSRGGADAKSIFCACLDAYWRKTNSEKRRRRSTRSLEQQQQTNSGGEKENGSHKNSDENGNEDITLVLLNLLRPLLQDLFPTSYTATSTTTADESLSSSSSSSSKIVSTTTTTILPVIRITGRNPLHIDIIEWQQQEEQQEQSRSSSTDDCKGAPAPAPAPAHVVDLSISNAKTIFQQSHLSDSIKQRANQITSQVLEKEYSVQDDNDDDDDDDDNVDNFSFYVASILWLCENKLRINSVSLSPIPCHGVSFETLQLLIGLPTNPNPNDTNSAGGSSAMIRITPTAVALLKTLLLPRRRQVPKEEEEEKEDRFHAVATNSSCCCPPMTLISVGAGALDSSTGETNSVRILLGTPTTTTAIVPTTNEPKNNLLRTSLADSDNNNNIKPVAVRTQLPPPSPTSYPWKTDRLVHMEANLDDITAEALAFAIQVLLQNGAVDAWVSPIVMKKGRAAHTLHCLCRQEKGKDDDDDDHPEKEKEDNNINKERGEATTNEPPPNNEEREGKKKGGKRTMWETLLHLIFQHTTTLGVRINRDVERAALHRKFVTVQTPYCSTRMVDVKVGYLQHNKDNDDDDDDDQNGVDVAIMSIKAEFDHCKDISLETGVPIQQIASHAVQEASSKVTEMMSTTQQQQAVL